MLENPILLLSLLHFLPYLDTPHSPSLFLTDKSFYIIQVSITHHVLFIYLFAVLCLYVCVTLKIYSSFQHSRSLDPLPVCTAMLLELVLPFKAQYFRHSSLSVVRFVKAAIAKMSFCFQMFSAFVTKRNVWLENCHVVSNEFCISLKEQELDAVLESFCF